jgi:two-component system, NtrC family, response regulator AtoC
MNCGSGSVGSVLIVEDTPSMAALMRMVLTGAGYEVVVAETGAEGLMWLETEPEPLLVILDLKLPDTDGFTLIGETRMHHASVPIMMVTAERDTREQALSAGADVHLYKPFRNDELVRCVQCLTDLDRTP